MDSLVLPVVLHGFHAAHSGREWMLPLILVAGIGTALLARWISRFFRRSPSDHDEPV
ncbi:MAG: hypothetical protein AB7R89_05900 [Dehalococcoidia bacterium]